MNTSIHLNLNAAPKGIASLLPASKSISNRALIINALAGGESSLSNLSDANDTQLMLKQINATDKTIDIEDAGTTMRFLSAYFTVINQNKILTGTPRMKERPIRILVDALRLLGAEIAYLEKDGYPPIEVKHFRGQQQNQLSIRGDISSQYISALMMIAPKLPQGLTLQLQGKIGSRPYIEMTASLMKHFGASCEFHANKVTIPNQEYKPAAFTVESDWSAASYWFAIAALADSAEISLPKLSVDSLQGDSVIVKIMDQLGVKATMIDGLLKLSKTTHKQDITWDFTNCPDLAQTVAVICAVKGVRGNFVGLESLRIKETDRIDALQKELQKIGADLIEIDHEHWTLVPSTKLPKSVAISTYKDHRMAMAFAPLATVMEVDIEEPDVVRKSYPNYWKDLQTVGIEIT